MPPSRRVEWKQAWRYLVLVWAALLFSVHASSAQTLPHNIPDFSQDSSRPTVRSVGTGRWADAATWQGGQVPTANHVVHVDPNHIVTIDTLTATAYTVAVHGTLRFAPAADSRLRVTNVMIMGDHGMPSMTTVGHVEMGTAANPIAAGRTAEIVVANTPLNAGVSDPEQFGNGLLNFGKLTIHGATLTKTFTRVAVEPRAGHTSLTLTDPATGWRVGDRLVLPDTRHMKESETTGSGWINAVNQWEERTVQSISADGRVVTLTQALQFDHLGARDLNGTLDFLPHVGHLTRNAVIRSESATGTRGHFISVHTADTDIRYALFRDLGRTTFKPLNTTTNLIGRYPIHMHHSRGPAVTPANGYQFTLIGNAIDGGSAATQFKWGIAIHNSHYGLIQDNVVYNYNGASIATEDGSESYNVFDHNFALRGMGEPNNAVSEARNAMGTEGVGFWFRGPNNYVRNNVAANFQNSTTEAAYGFVYQFIRLGNVSIPTFKGANPAITGQFTTRNGNNLPILQFDDNEAYGAMQGGFTYWWVGSQDPQPYADAKESLIKNLKIWHVYNKAVYHYPSSKITFDGLIIRGKFDASARCCGNGVYGADYSTKGVIIRNSNIQGMEEGIQFPEAGFGPEPNLTVESSYLRNNSNIQIPTNGSVNGCWMQNKLVVITNTRFDAPPGRSLNNIAMVRDVGFAPECLSKLNEARVYAYNGVATDNFQVYHTSTSVVPRPPSSCTPTTRAGINGLLCPIAALGPVPPTVTMTASPSSITTGQSSTLTWSATNATTVSINQGIGTVTASGTRSVSPTATTTYTITATNNVGSVTALATVTVSATPTPTPTLTLTASPASINAGGSSTLTWSSTNATSVSINQSIGGVATSGSRSVSPSATTTYTATATGSGGTTTATATVTVAVPTTPHTKARANAYDDAWQDGPGGWVENARAILGKGTGQVPGLVLWIGDSLTRDPALGAWAQKGNGKTAEDQAITTWMHAGLSPQGVDSIDGFALATPYICSARSFTVGDGLGSWHFMGSSMPTDTNPTTAKQKLLNCSSYPNALNLRTMLAALQPAQFAIPEVNLDAANPGSFPDFQAMVDLMISKGIVPIIITYTYRTDAAFNNLVDQYNTALVNYARTKKLPLIDFQAEMLARLPFSQWPGRFLADGVHYTRGTTTHPSTADPYANGGDPATHTTGLALTHNGYGLKGWLGVQKMKEIKALVVDTMTPPQTPPTATLNASPLSVVQGDPSVLTWSATDVTSVTISPNVGTFAASGSITVNPASTTTYTLSATNGAGTATSSATVTVTAQPTPAMPTATLTANDYSISAGETVTLTWLTTGAQTVSLSNGIGSVGASGNTTVSPTATTSYVLTASNAAGAVTSMITVVVTQAPVPQGPAFANVGLTAGWATFGQAVPRGAATNGLMVGTFPTQTDVKNRWPDGSIKFAVVSVHATANGTFGVYPATLNAGTFTPNPVEDTSVAFKIGGTPYTAALPETASADAWLSGPLVREDRHVVTPVTAGNVAHPFLRVNFDRRSYSDGHARLDVSVENVLDTNGATTVTYDVDVVLNRETVFSKLAVEHYYLTRWRKVFDTSTSAESEITPELNAFYQTRALPPYLPLVTNVVSTTDGPSFDILQPGAVLANMPAHGGRPELAPYPDWTARYLVHRDLRQRRFVLAHGDLSGSWPIHVRQAEGAAASGIGAERYVSLDQRPTVWLDGRAQGAGVDYIHGTPLPIREYTTTTPGPRQSPLIPDNAHQPSLAYVPYLLTGDRFYAEEMAFWASYAMLRTSNGNGVRSSAGILESNEVRGFGWALRNLVDAAAYYPDASPMKAHLVQKVTNNLTWLDAYANSQDPITNPFRALWVGRRPEGPGFRGLWEENYLAYAIDRAFQQGFSGGLAHRDAIAKFQLLLFTSEPDYPRLHAAPSVVGVGTTGSGGLIYYRTMSEIWNATASQTRPFAGYYGPEARLNLMIGVTNGWFGAQEAYDYLWPFVGVNPTWPAPDLAVRAGWALDYYPGVTPPTSEPAPVPAALISPVPGSVLSSTVVTFSWSAGTRVSSYQLAVGTTPGGAEIRAGTPGTDLITTVSGLPSDGRTVFVRLSSLINGVWRAASYQFTAMTPPPTTAPAVLSAPAPGSVLAGTTQTFSWTSGTGVADYRLSVGTTQGGSQLYAGAATTALTATVSGLPSIGVKVWARLSSRINGNWVSADYEFTSYTASASGITVRQTVSVNGTGQVSSPALTTSAANEILLALVASSGPTGSKQQVTVTGGGLTWTRARLANAQYGTAEVWWVKVASPTAGIVVTSKQLVAGHDQSLTVIRLGGASGIGTTVQHNAIDEAPRVTVTTTRANSLVFAVGNDSYSATARTVAPGQVMINEWLDTRIADAFWVQTFAGPVANSGSTVRLYVTAPVKSRWNFAAVEIVR